MRDKRRKIAEASTAFGAGLQTSIVRQLGEFTIIARDEDGNQRLTGGDQLAVAIRGTSNVRPRLVDNDDGTYTCTYRAWVSGIYNVMIWLNNVSLGESPYTLHVLSTRAAASKCELRGTGLNHAVAREPASFEVEFVDAFGQVCYAEELDMYVELVYSPRMSAIQRGTTDGASAEAVQICDVTDEATLDEAAFSEFPPGSAPQQEFPAASAHAPSPVAAPEPGPATLTEDKAPRDGSPASSTPPASPSAPAPTLTIEEFLSEGGGEPAPPEGLKAKPPSIPPQQPAALMANESVGYRRLDAIERQQHMALWCATPIISP
jgi:hypothetical protein